MYTVDEFLSRDKEEAELYEVLKKRSNSNIKNTFNRIYGQLNRTSDIKEITKLNTELLLLIMEQLLKEKK